MAGDRSQTARAHGWRFAVAASAGVVLAALFVTLRFPVFFHWDDCTYLLWAKRNALAIFEPSQSTLFGTYRPALLLSWWGMSRLFGLNAPLYQFFITLLYGATFVLFYLLLRRLFGQRAATGAVLGYFVVFFPVSYIVFWFSDLTFVQELFLIVLALHGFLPLFEGRRPRFWWPLLASCAAVLTKEPSALVITSVLFALAWARWPVLEPEARRRLCWVLPTVAIAGFAWLASAPALRTRHGFGLTTAEGGVLAFVAQRWEYYASQLLSPAGLLLWVGVLFLAARALSPARVAGGVVGTALLLALAMTVSLLLRRYPSLALLVLLAACLPAIARRRELAALVAWAFVPLLAYLGVELTTRAYLSESSFGFAALLGVAAAEASRAVDGLPRGRARRLLALGAAVVLLAAAIPVTGLAGRKLRALQVLSDNRQNFRDVSDYVLGHPLPPDAAMAVITYRDMGLAYGGGVDRMSDEQKAGLQNTMESSHLPQWFRLHDRPDIRVFGTFEDYLRSAPDSCWVWVMNVPQKRAFDRLPLRKRLLYEVHRRGEGAWLYLVTR